MASTWWFWVVNAGQIGAKMKPFGICIIQYNRHTYCFPFSSAKHFSSSLRTPTLIAWWMKFTAALDLASSAFSTASCCWASTRASVAPPRPGTGKPELCSWRCSRSSSCWTLVDCWLTGNGAAQEWTPLCRLPTTGRRMLPVEKNRWLA